MKYYSKTFWGRLFASIYIDEYLICATNNAFIELLEPNRSRQL